MDFNAGLMRDWFFVATNVASGGDGDGGNKMRMGNYTGTRPLETGDLVVVLYGLDTPCVLRRVRAGEGGESEKDDGGCEGQENYEFVGTAYVHGLMDGEALDLVESGDASVQDFVIA